MESSLINLLVGCVFGFLFALVLISVIRRRSRRGNMLESYPAGSGLASSLAPPPHTRSTLDLGRELAPEIEQLIRGGNKIAAVALVRERAGLGLKDATETVDMMERVLKRMS